MYILRSGTMALFSATPIPRVTESRKIRTSNRDDPMLFMRVFHMLFLSSLCSRRFSESHLHVSRLMTPHPARPIPRQVRQTQCSDKSSPLNEAGKQRESGGRSVVRVNITAARTLVRPVSRKPQGEEGRPRCRPPVPHDRAFASVEPIHPSADMSGENGGLLWSKATLLPVSPRKAVGQAVGTTYAHHQTAGRRGIRWQRLFILTMGGSREDMNEIARRPSTPTLLSMMRLSWLCDALFC